MQKESRGTEVLLHCIHWRFRQNLVRNFASAKHVRTDCAIRKAPNGHPLRTDCVIRMERNGHRLFNQK
jgi:hypothetical protein